MKNSFFQNLFKASLTRVQSKVRHCFFCGGVLLPGFVTSCGFFSSHLTFPFCRKHTSPLSRNVTSSCNFPTKIISSGLRTNQKILINILSGNITKIEPYRSMYIVQSQLPSSQHFVLFQNYVVWKQLKPLKINIEEEEDLF